MEKNHVGLLNHSLNHPAYLMPREPKLLLRNVFLLALNIVT